MTLANELERLSAAATRASEAVPFSLIDYKATTAELERALRNNLPAIIAALRAQQHADALADGMDRAITFIEALADNDLDEPIADNGMTVGAGLQMKAPSLIFKLRAALENGHG